MKTMADVQAVENLVWQWTNKWPYDVPKERIVATLSASLAELKKQTESAPDNVELLLLTALVAHYAHNVDVDGAAQAAFELLERVHRLAPDEYRYGWFLGLHKCQTGRIKEGTDLMLAIESSMEWQRLPAGFWDDYIFCTQISNMPVHELRAAGHLTKLKDPPSAQRDALVEIAGKRIKTPDVTATYTYNEVWTGEKNSDGLTVVNSMLGLQLWSHGDWRVEPSGVNQGKVTVSYYSGPHKAKSGMVSPGLVVLARPPKPAETLSDFLNQSWPNGPVLWHGPALDITKPVVDAYNAQSGIAPPPPRQGGATGATGARPSGAGTSKPSAPTTKPAAPATSKPQTTTTTPPSK